jgi:hypothetical protein
MYNVDLIKVTEFSYSGHVTKYEHEYCVNAA